MKSHLLSQVLLKRFSRNGVVRINYKQSYTSKLKSPREFGFINLPENDFTKLERNWQHTEKRVNQAFKSLDSGSLLEDGDSIETIKKLMGLHYFRSNAFFILLSKTEPRYFNSFIDDAIKNHPSKKDEILKNIPNLKITWYRDLKKNVIELLESLSKKVDSYIKQYDIEIGIVEGDVNLALSDNPAINLTKEGRMGILSGVTIDQSDGFVMPLGPKHIAALITKNDTKHYRKLTIREVGNINEKCIRQSIAEYYTLP